MTRDDIRDAHTHGLRGVFLLLLCVEVGLLHLAHAEPQDFICNATSRRLLYVTEDLRNKSESCSQLPSAVPKPCFGFTMKTWNHFSLQQKQAFVWGRLEDLRQSLQAMKELSTSACQTEVLKTLERKATNLLKILEALDGHIRPTSSSSQMHGCNMRSLTEVLEFYQKLLQGPVEMLMRGLKHNCTHTHTHTHSQRGTTD